MRQKKQGNDRHHFMNCVYGSFTPEEREKKTNFGKGTKRSCLWTSVRSVCITFSGQQIQKIISLTKIESVLPL